MSSGNKAAFYLSFYVWLALATWSHTLPTGSASSGTLREVDWWGIGQEELQNALKVRYNVASAKNVVLFIGDGMGPSTVTAARILKSQRKQINLEKSKLAWETFPHVALAKTYNADSQTPDSAGTATAFLTGEKVRRGTIGLDQTVTRGNCASSVGHGLKTIFKHSHDVGKWTGVVSTTRLTHATPAASFAQTAERDWESDGNMPEADRAMCKDIARQLVEDNDFIRVMLGGGRMAFLPNSTSDPEYAEKNGTRADGRNLIEEWRSKQLVKEGMSEAKVKVVMNRTDFVEVDPMTTHYLIGLFDHSHMQYEADRANRNVEPWGEPSLAEMTEKAISILSRNSEHGYFLLVEGGRIDHAHHDNNAHRALTEVLALSDAVQRAVSLTDPSNTLVIVTADHSHTMTISGYPTLDNNILGVTNLLTDPDSMAVADDGLPYLALNYANGPGWYYHRHNQTAGRRNLTEDAVTGRTESVEYLQDSAIPLSAGASHGGEDVAIYARGPMAHLLHGIHQQNYIAHVMMYASCVGPNRNHCTNPHPFPGCPTNAAPALVVKGGSFAILNVLLAVFLFICDLNWKQS